MTNQGKAWKLTREFDKGRNKTLVVFTKPDAELEGETTRDLVATAVGDYPVELNGQSAYHAVSCIILPYYAASSNGSELMNIQSILHHKPGMKRSQMLAA